SVRRTCFGGGHNSGSVRFWYNGQPIDSGPGRDAGSRLLTTIGLVSADYFVRGGLTLETSAGTARQFVDVRVNSAAACPDRPFVPFATWTTTPT
ncbi:MAG: hypothetical protein ACREMQ_05875, partial [Longimicrobiales bacterium]